MSDDTNPTPDLSKAILAENLGSTDTPDPEVDLSESIIAGGPASTDRGADGDIVPPGDGLDSDLLPPAP